MASTLWLSPSRERHHPRSACATHARWWSEATGRTCTAPGSRGSCTAKRRDGEGKERCSAGRPDRDGKYPSRAEEHRGPVIAACPHCARPSHSCEKTHRESGRAASLLRTL